jgi:hypothetical protein
MKDPATSRPGLPGVVRAWSDFWLTPVDPVGLHTLRVLAGLLLLFWLLPLAGQAHALFGLGGWFDTRAFVEASRLPGGTPAPAGWSLLYLCGQDVGLLRTAYWGAVGALVLFTLGVMPRLTSVLTWLVVASFIVSPVTGTEADSLLLILALYLMLGHLFLGQWSRPLSRLERVLGSRQAPGTPSHAAGLAVRLIQVHFAIILVTSGLHKLQFGDWWSGVAYWYPANPPFEVSRESLRRQAESASSYLGVLSLLQYAALAWQLTFPLFAWKRSWRAVLLAGAACGWVGSAWVYRDPVFGPLLFVVCLSYLTPEEWHRVRGWRGWLAAKLRPRASVEGVAVVEARGGEAHV